MISGYHFRHFVTVYRVDPTQAVDPVFGEVDGTKQYTLIGMFRAYVRFLNEEERAITQIGEDLETEGKALFRVQDLGGKNIRPGDRLVINGQFAYEVKSCIPRAPRLGKYLTLEVNFVRYKTAPDAGIADISAVLVVS